MLKPLLTAALAVLLTAVPALAEWTYIDGGGKTVTLPEAPKRIVAHANVAAGLIPLGIRPVGIYVDGPVKDDPSLIKGLIEESIRARLFALPDDTVVHTGHGDDTTIGAEAERLGR